MYHCGTPPVMHHIASGMYGTIVVDPASSLPPAREYVLVQSELYLTQQADGYYTTDGATANAVTPTYVVFNISKMTSDCSWPAKGPTRSWRARTQAGTVMKEPANGGLWVGLVVTFFHGVGYFRHCVKPPIQLRIGGYGGPSFRQS
jgi:FtsP/CotA-like multicopper oxidase with cupredoxin domain